jgi:predicted metalloprotease with PDZ domain
MPLRVEGDRVSESKNQLPRWIMAIGAVLWAIPAAAATASYVVTVDPEDKRLAFVEARITTNEDFLLMYPEGADHRPAGWSTYLRNLVATDGAGREVALLSSGRDRWVRPSVDGDELVIRYQVLIHHDAGRWPFGWDEAAYVKGDSIFYTGKALFILALDLRDITVEFRIPEEWGLVTPWSPAGRPRTFRVANPVELTEVAIMTGLFTERTIRAGDASVTLAAGPGLRPSLPLVEETIHRSLDTISDIFCGSPPERFVIAMNLEDAFSGGGAFRRSVSMLFQEPPALENRAEWSHIIVHELLHLWIGGAMEAAEFDEEQWLTEGVTEYRGEPRPGPDRFVVGDRVLEAGRGASEEIRGRCARRFAARGGARQGTVLRRGLQRGVHHRSRPRREVTRRDRR